MNCAKASSWLRWLHGVSFAPTVIDCRYSTIHSLREIDENLFTFDEIWHNCGLDHHGYDEVIACVMTADTELDCLERLDEGTHRFCRACQHVVDRKLVSSCKMVRHTL